MRSQKSAGPTMPLCIGFCSLICFISSNSSPSHSQLISHLFYHRTFALLSPLPRLPFSFPQFCLLASLISFWTQLKGCLVGCLGSFWTQLKGEKFPKRMNVVCQPHKRVRSASNRKCTLTRSEAYWQDIGKLMRESSPWEHWRTRNTVKFLGTVFRAMPENWPREESSTTHAGPLSTRGCSLHCCQEICCVASAAGSRATLGTQPCHQCWSPKLDTSVAILTSKSKWNPHHFVRSFV